MKPLERDNLLIRLDERTRNIYNLTEKQEDHLSKLNDALSKHAIGIEGNRVSIKWLRIILISVILGGGGAGLYNIFGG